MTTLNPLNHETVVRLRIRGAVMQSGFRGWSQRQADMRGLDGWVRYRMDDQSVEMILAGSLGLVQDMIDTCRSGPRLARVDGVEEQPVDPDAPIWVGFHQLPPR